MYSYIIFFFVAEKKTGICNLKLESRKPADRSALLAWEQVM